MGFICPVCKEDFGRDQIRFKIHSEKEHDGAVKLGIEGMQKVLIDPERKGKP